MAHALYVYCMRTEKNGLPTACTRYALCLCTPYAPPTGCAPPYAHRIYAHQCTYAHTVCTHATMSTVFARFAHHAWVQLHFGRLKQRQAALLGKPQHNYISPPSFECERSPFLWSLCNFRPSRLRHSCILPSTHDLGTGYWLWGGVIANVSPQWTTWPDARPDPWPNRARHTTKGPKLIDGKSVGRRGAVVGSTKLFPLSRNCFKSGTVLKRPRTQDQHAARPLAGARVKEPPHPFDSIHTRQPRYYLGTHIYTHRRWRPNASSSRGARSCRG